MEIPTFFSNKLRILSFIAIIGVLISHSYFTENNAWTVNAFIQNLVGCQLARFCIPLFFFISGYLFFRETREGGFKKIFMKMHSRVHSLLVPYVLWNLLFFLSIIFLQLLPVLGSKINTDFLTILSTRSCPELFLFIFWEPAAFHLWFLQYLIIFIVLSPLFYLLFHNKRATIAVFFILYAATGIYEWGGNNMQGLLFFLLGGFISYIGINIERIQRRTAILISSAVYLAWCTINCLYPEFQYPFLDMLRLPLGAYSVWGLYDFITVNRPGLQNKILSWAPYTFFIYVFHEPWINIYKKSITLLLPSNETILLAAYFTAPLVMASVSIAIARILQRHAGKAYSILTGGRI